MAYSVVMAVYKNDRSEWLVQALESLVNQTAPSNDIVIVADGPLTSKVNATLRKYVNGKTISLVRLKANQGLGNALNIGLKHTKNELVARMDADDISVPTRFEFQIAEFKRNPELDILGGQIAEFIDNPDQIVAYRKVPVSNQEIQKFARRRNPFNHPTVMYKKSVIEKIGNYDASAIRIEDYDLWLRALSNGANCANLDLTLINYRLTPDAIRRRKTITSLKNHINARTRFYKKKYITFADLVYGVITQTALFVIPAELAGTIFSKAVRNAKA